MITVCTEDYGRHLGGYRRRDIAAAMVGMPLRFGRDIRWVPIIAMNLTSSRGRRVPSVGMEILFGEEINTAYVRELLLRPIAEMR